MKSTARAEAPVASTAYARTRSPGASTQSARLRYQGSVWKKLALPARDRSGSYRAGSAARSVYTAVVYMCNIDPPVDAMHDKSRTGESALSARTWSEDCSIAPRRFRRGGETY